MSGMGGFFYQVNYALTRRAGRMRRISTPSGAAA